MLILERDHLSSRLAIIRLNLKSLETTVLRRSSELAVAEEDLSVMQAVEFPTAGGLTAYGFFYPPKNHALSCTGRRFATIGGDESWWTNRGCAVTIWH